jgi:uncharacterized protein YjdB
MTFTYKLSKRLAHARSAIAVLAVAVAACIAGDPSVSGPTQKGLADVSGSAVLLQDDFEDNSLGARGWYDFAGTPTVTDTTHAPGSTHALEARFARGANTPPWIAARRLFTPSPTLYISYWVRYSDNWVGSGQAYHPHEFSVLSDLDGDWDGPADNYLNAYIEHNYQNGGIPRIQVQDNKTINTGASVFRTGGGTVSGTDPVANSEQRSVGGCNGGVPRGLFWECFSFGTASGYYNDWQLKAPGVAFQPNPGPGYKGNWNHVEVYFAINSVVGGVARADGVVQYWFNGTLLIDRHDLMFRTGARPNINFRQFIMAPYIGDGSPVDQTMWIDNLVVAAAPPSSAPAAPVAVVAVAPAASTLTTGQTLQLAATLTDALGGVLTGRTVTWATSDASVATVNASGLVTGVAAGSASITATSEGISGTAAVTVSAPTSVKPAAVTDLAVTATTSTSLTLAFTEVNDGTGQPAKYDVRVAAGTLAWGSASSVTQGTCATPVTGTTIGARRTCTILGLTATTAYQVQLVSFRGTMNQNAVYGPLSNVASGTTNSTTQAAVVSVTVAPASASVRVGGTVSLTATLKDASGNVLTGRTVTWTTSATAVATVSTAGVVTGVAVGSATITATSGGVSGTAAVTVTATPKPGRVTTLAVANVSTNSVTLSFTEVGDGTGQPAKYDVRFAAGTISWGSAQSVSQGTCSTPLAGTAIGATRSCTVLGLAAGTKYQFQLVAYRGTLNVSGVVFGALSNVTTGTTATATTNPGQVTNLSVASVATDGVTLTFKEVADGAGQPAQYDVRYAPGTMSWGSASSVTQGTCATPLAGTTVGATRSCTVLGLTAGTAYQFQLVAFRAVVNASTVYGALSNVVSGTTAGGAAPPPPPPPPPPTGGGAWPNEPAGMTLLSDEPFNAMTENGWNVVQRQTTNGSGVSIMSDATAPVSPSSVLAMKYAAGYQAGSEPGGEYLDPATPVKETFVGFWWKASNPWQWHPSGVNKIAFLFTAVDNIYIMMYNDGGGPTIQVEPQLLNDVRRLAPNVTATTVTLGQWHRIEWYVKYATSGTSHDGIVRWWLDGVLQGEYTDLQTTPSSGVVEYIIAPTWGGIGGTKTETDYYWYDHYHISRR